MWYANKIIPSANMSARQTSGSLPRRGRQTEKPRPLSCTLPAPTLPHEHAEVLASCLSTQDDRVTASARYFNEHRRRSRYRWERANAMATSHATTCFLATTLWSPAIRLRENLGDAVVQREPLLVYSDATGAQNLKKKKACKFHFGVSCANSLR